jgi:hypothetical protein
MHARREGRRGSCKRILSRDKMEEDDTALPKRCVDVCER